MAIRLDRKAIRIAESGMRGSVPGVAQTSCMDCFGRLQPPQDWLIHHTWFKVKAGINGTAS